MGNTVSYKIHNAYKVPYQTAINREAMDLLDSTVAIIKDSRVYLICKIEIFNLENELYSKPEVVYVGETFNKKKRFYKHEHLFKATTLLKPNETLLIYFLQMRFSFLGMSPFKNHPLELFDKVRDIDNKSSVWLIERLLIKLFCPRLNKRFKELEVKKDRIIKRELIDEHVRYAHVDIGMEDHNFNFIGGMRNEKVDWYTFDLTKDELLFGYFPQEFNIQQQ